ncbi:polysaccharide pyruvyl transferase family protein [Streptomyces sp. NPDC093109]|uniref:polysaccharide pyruvyl transferase family protein n=1 Tax=Streptomyces sp. NPDC093109 TaxID=3154977 RepID=UPI00344CCB09
MKRILIRSGKSPFRVATREEFIQQDLIGTNSGNLLFSDAAHKILLTDRTEVTSNGLRTVASAERAQQINEEYDVFVVPLANAFRPTFSPSLDRLSNLIEQLTIPVVVLGVGAQAGDDYDTERLKAIEPSVKRFMRAVLERSASVGVRGELTASYLRELGFHEVETIGCPSMFLYGDTFPTLRDPGTFDADSRIAINLSAQAIRVGDLAGLARHAHERFPHLTYYAQNLVDAETLFWGDTSAASGVHDVLPRRLTHPLLQENKVRVPLEPRTWMDELAEQDFSYGTRIHGNIAALLAGTPAVVLAHDSRTLELCRYFGIPHRMLAGLPGDVHPEELYEQADFSGLADGHKERFGRFKDFLDKNSLENVFSHGDGGAAYDARQSAMDLPSSVEVWDGSDDGALRYRISRLREQLVENKKVADRHITTLTKTNKELQKQVAKMQKQLAATEQRISGIEKRAAVRFGPAIRRRIRGAKPSSA